MDIRFPSVSPAYGNYPAQSGLRQDLDADSSRFKQTQGQSYDAGDEAPDKKVYRGEVLEAANNDRRYNPNFNQQVDPRYQDAIASYQNSQLLAQNPSTPGAILDRYV